jgi:hypothetical protein
MILYPLDWTTFALCALELLAAYYAPRGKLRALLLWLPVLHTIGGIAVLFVLSRLAPDSPHADPHLAPILWFGLTLVYELALSAVALVALGTVLVLNVRAKVRREDIVAAREPRT